MVPRVQANAATTARLRMMTNAARARVELARTNCLTARLASRPSTHFARLRGEVDGAPLRALVRQDGSAAGDHTWLRLAELAPDEMPGEIEWPSPLRSTFLLAHACDRLLAIEFVDVGRPNSPFAAGFAAMWRRDASSFCMEVAQDGAVHHVRLTGEVDIAVAATLKDRLVDIAGSTVDVDLSGVTFLDARGLAALLDARSEITEAGHAFHLRGAHGIIRRVFELTDLAHLLVE